MITVANGIKIGEYSGIGAACGRGLAGWVEPSCNNPGWIIYFTHKGNAVLYTKRELDGTLIGKPIRLKARVKAKK